jgi:lipopolysaccharide transport system ATP-binding protein
VGTGFHPELTGRENVFLNGAILGMARAEIQRKFAEIVAFAEIEQFIDTQVKFYSSGMYLRLAFAVAAHLEPEILIVDEVLAVGDAAFQKKCMGKMGEVSKEGRTVLLVSHNMLAISSLCTRALLLEGGKLRLTGDPYQVVGIYASNGETTRVFRRADSPPSQRAFIEEVRVESPCEPDREDLQRAEGVRVRLRFHVREPINSGQVSIQLVRRPGEIVFVTTNMDMLGHKDVRLAPGDYTSQCVIPGSYLRSGEYYLHVAINVPGTEMIDMLEEIVSFEVQDPDALEIRLGGQGRGGVITPILEWDVRGPDA